MLYTLLVLSGFAFSIKKASQQAKMYPTLSHLKHKSWKLEMGLYLSHIGGGTNYGVVYNLDEKYVMRIKLLFNGYSFESHFINYLSVH